MMNKTLLFITIILSFFQVLKAQTLDKSIIDKKLELHDDAIYVVNGIPYEQKDSLKLNSFLKSYSIDHLAKLTKLKNDESLVRCRNNDIVIVEIKENRKKTILVNKEDGFYSVIDFDSRKNKLKDLKLSAKPEIFKVEIVEIKRIKDQLDRNVIDIRLTKKGAKKFKILTENNIGKPIAIVLNKMLISAPIVWGVIPNGRIQISGNFSEEEIQYFVNSIKK